MNFDHFRELVITARSYRRFREDKPVDAAILEKAVDTARLVPSSSNRQPLRYAVSVNAAMNSRIFPFLRWAGQLKEWPGPAEGERPAGYIIIGGDMAYPKTHQVDLGIAAQTMQLALASEGIACCMLASINARAIHELVGFPGNVNVLLALAVGYPGETIRLEDMPPDGKTSYWRDENGGHHVPKRALSDVLLANFS